MKKLLLGKLIRQVWADIRTTRLGTVVLTLVFIGGIALISVLHDPNLVGNVFLVAMTAEAWVFVLLYLARSEWRSTMPGRAVMYSNLAFAFLGTQVSLSAILGRNYPGRDLIRPYLYLGLVLSMLNMGLTLYRYQRAARAATREERDNGQADPPA